ncbi:MAG: phosphate butyryltransferase, partial [Spirochaetales bacterium]|nr:phosphate butyryltransferase [Spirochaetales bacterium]
MQRITSFAELERLARERPCRRLALAMAQEGDALKAAVNAAGTGIVEPVLVGDETQIRRIAEQEGLDIAPFSLVHCEGEEAAAVRAVDMVRDGQADLLMKGKVSTTIIMRAVLGNRGGLRGSGLLSHVTIIEVDTYPKLLFMSDPGVNIAPDLKTKVSIIENAVAVARAFGIDRPKVAAITAVEKVNADAMPATVDAALLAKMSDRDQIAGCVVDGPFALDNAISEHSCEVKGIQSEVGGDADILLMPDIEAANVFY